ncbi:endolytic transglycosylase MltG [Pelagovum pacificum]|uniref:Endolytic murein transglycosylase n=1 Tax=Pelagovum pacificum TaxID=2588711 RepID=A0A5C5GAX1_9RHOB|nr:endolytic transglycosylase MltG [Pelagovum pacificum]QQA41246.1 endolytic transglycosylase MltG [Pelagovum pacificum]TNY31945.1 endolytic transglycosylase MltG [Pelagovum pacificum]
MWRSIASNALTFFVVATFLMAGVVIWGNETYEGEGPLADAICLQVDRGSNFWTVSETLANDGAITSPTLFRMGAQYAGKADQLKAGSFLLPEKVSMQEIVDIVTRGGANTCGTEVIWRVGVTRTLVEVRELDPVQGSYEQLVQFDPAEEETPPEFTEVTEAQDTLYRLAIAEGVTSWQIVQALNAIEQLSEDVEDIPDEGTLAPDSYAFEPGDTVDGLLAQMEVRQQNILQDAWAARADGLPYESPEEALIMASIVEKETGIPSERGQVASVFVNRLEQGMRLQTDPTVIYGVTEGQGVLGRGLRQSELRAATPWNTYVIQGLPPTPIANPGRAAIEAALNPDTTDYVFFVADGSGGHAFATTLDEHNRNVARWREIEAEQAATTGE